MTRRTAQILSLERLLEVYGKRLRPETVAQVRAMIGDKVELEVVLNFTETGTRLHYRQKPAAKGTKVYSHNGYAGCVTQRKSRQTGFLVGLYHGDQAGMDTDDGKAPWSTVCEEHGSVCCHASMSLATAHLADPAGWCEDCQAIVHKGS